MTQRRTQLLPILVICALIILWFALPPLIPLGASPLRSPILITAINTAALVWFVLALLLTGGWLVLFGWRIRRPVRSPKWRHRLRGFGWWFLLFVLWMIVPFMLGGNLNSRPNVMIRAASPASLGWFLIALAATGLACFLMGQMLYRTRVSRSNQQQVLRIVEEQLDAGIGLFDRHQQPMWLNMSGKFYMYHDNVLNADVQKLLQRAAESNRLAAQSFNVDEKLRVNVQAAPLSDGSISVVTRLLQGEIDQNAFYERFIRRIVHDMRNPLAAIIAHAGNLYATPPSETAAMQNAARTIETEAQRLTRLVDSMLFDARLSYVPINAERFDVRDVIEEVMFQHDERAIREGKSIEVEMPPDPSPIEADRDLLLRAVSNLVDNSLKYSKASASVRIVLEKSGAVYKLAVIDTGDGIPPDYLPNKIFEPLVRARKDGVSGSGLGLAIVKKIIDLHTGSITAQSTLGEGTTVIITLKRNLS
jgi:signal transduction histidine kinase